MNAAARLGDFHALHPVSAKTGDGIGALRDGARRPAAGGAALLPAGAAHRPLAETQIAELIREKALWLTRDEVPHAISVEVDELGEKVVRAFILVETESQKQIVVGKGGAIVKEIGTRARPEIEALLGHQVFLELVVKVRPHWRRDEAALDRLERLARTARPAAGREPRLQRADARARPGEVGRAAPGCRRHRRAGSRSPAG